MVNRLRKALAKDRRSAQRLVNKLDSLRPKDNEEGVREMDDDEVDADLMLENDTTVDDSANVDETLDTESLQPALVLPLYSLLSTEEQALVFQPPPEGHRLIVVATNVAETSITIPGISYVVDSGRQKCRNYHAATGMASYDVMWISKASADQRAGRAGRTGPGHCYRLYSSSLYARHMDEFAMPEVLTRPLEDVVLAMKAMNITNVTDFPFPTPLHSAQLQPAFALLSNLGCVDTTNADDGTNDGVITRLGAAVAKLPLGVRHGKMLLVAAQAGVLDYAVMMIAALSEQSPFLIGNQVVNDGTTDPTESATSPENEESVENQKRTSNRWSHRGGDVLASVIATGAYAYAGRDAGGAAERLACSTFCSENGLNGAVMTRIHTLRRHVARLVHVRLPQSDGLAAKTGGFVSSMPPPNKLHDVLLRQALLAGLLDNVAMLAPLGSISGDGGSSYSLRTAYLSSSASIREPLFLDRNSVLHSRDPRRLPQWVCYETLERKVRKDGTPIAVMRRVTPIDPAWLGEVAAGSRLLTFGDPLEIPRPVYDAGRDEVMCSIVTKFGRHGWEVPPVKRGLSSVLADLASRSKHSPHYGPGDEYRWFARFLLEGKVIAGLEPLRELLNDDPSVMTTARGSSSLSKKAVLLVSALEGAGICTGQGLREHWAKVDDKFLFKYLKHWVKQDDNDKVRALQRLWISVVRECVNSVDPTTGSG
jgi:ATP-dependent RNA helicase DHX37/DHR1